MADAHHDSRLHGAFGQDAFGRHAERAARFFGTPQYILGQTIAVVIWIVLNAVGIVRHWDPYPFILLNLAFSTQAAYAAPLILLAQTRQADRDKATALHVEHRHDEQRQRGDESLAELRSLLAANTALTEQVAELTRSIDAKVGAR